MPDGSWASPGLRASAPPLLQVQLIGDFAVLDRGLPVRVQQGGQRLLAILSLSRRPLPRSRIAGTLWPESPADQASANLRAAITRLPRPGGNPLIDNGNSGMNLSADVEVDVRVCELHMQHLVSQRPEPPVPLTADVLHMLGEDVLPFWPDDWVLVDRERHRQARLHALEGLSRTLCRAGRFEEALQAGLAAVSGESLRETAHCRVIEVHLAEGNQGEALRQYEVYRRILRTELGLSPSLAISHLVRSLLGRPHDARLTT